MTYVLDTNTVIATLAGDERVTRRLQAIPPRNVLIPLVVVGELLCGAYRSARRTTNLARVRALRDAFPGAPIDEALIELYATVLAQVEMTGRPKSDFDLLIACYALQRQAVLVTNDAALKSGGINGLSVEDWLQQ